MVERTMISFNSGILLLPIAIALIIGIIIIASKRNQNMALWSGLSIGGFLLLKFTTFFMFNIMFTIFAGGNRLGVNSYRFFGVYRFISFVTNSLPILYLLILLVIILIKKPNSGSSGYQPKCTQCGLLVNESKNYCPHCSASIRNEY